MTRTTALLMGALTAASLGVSFIFFLAFWPFQTIEVEEPIKVLTKTVQAGKPVQYVVHQCRYTKVESTINKTLVGTVDGRNVTLTLGNSGQLRPRGCATYISPGLIIPKETPGGTYHIELTASFQVNPIQNISKSFRTEDFEVVNADPAYAIADTVISEAAGAKLLSASGASGSSPIPKSTTEPQPTAKPRATATPQQAPAIQIKLPLIPQITVPTFLGL